MTEPVLHISVSDWDGRASLRLELAAGVSPARLLAGKKRADALRLVPLLFNLCPMAHRAAAAFALGLKPMPDTTQGLAKEILREHAMVMLRDWPQALGQSADYKTLKGLAILSPKRLDQLEMDLFAGSASIFLACGALKDIAEETDAIAALREVRSWPGEYGRVLSAPDPTYMVRCMREDDNIACADDAFFPSLYLRMFARMREAGRLIMEIRSGEVTARSGLCPDGSAWAEAARGRLNHQARLADDRIADYSICTPTEKMTEPDGFLEQMLSSALEAPPNIRRKLFAIAMSCADPCARIAIAKAA